MYIKWTSLVDILVAQLYMVLTVSDNDLNTFIH